MSFRIIIACSATSCFCLRKKKNVPTNRSPSRMSWCRINFSLSGTKNNRSMRFGAPMFRCSARCQRTCSKGAAPRRLTCKQITGRNPTCLIFLIRHLCGSFIPKSISLLPAPCLHLKRNLSPSSAGTPFQI